MSSRLKRLQKRVGETDVRFNGRTLKFEVFVNTDEDINVIALRLNNAAKGAKQAMCLVTGSEVAPEYANEIWKTATNAAVESIDKEN